MSLLPDIDRILLGPGPSLTSPRVMRAMAAPTVSHLDPLMMALLDDVRARLARLFRAPEGSFAFAVSGTGTSGMETAVANLVAGRHARARRRHRLLRRSARADVRALRRDRDAARRRVGPGLRSRRAARRRSQATPADIVAMVHAETSTGVLNPVDELAADRARARRADDRGCGDLVRRASARRRRPGASTLLQLHAEVPRRAVRPGAGRLRRRARSSGACKCRSFYFDLAAARGLLAAAQVSPHDVVDARLRARRGAGDRRRGRARGALGAARAEPPRVRRRA